MPSRRDTMIGLVFVFTSGLAWSADDPKAVEHFEAKIRPVLIEHCLTCHSEDAATKKKLRGGLRLDTRAGWLKGGDTGPVLVPGKPAESLLVKTLKHDGDIQMPPEGKLPAAVIADFETWIANGAVDPRTDAATRTIEVDIEKGRQFWSYQPPKATPGATVDTLIRAKWVEKGLKPNTRADRRTLIRRAAFDLTGLPPTPDEVDAFVRDESADAWQKLIDRLLASSNYGERWARHWLDVARYAEDQAHTFGVQPKTNAYVYRDWVIRAFNTDLPYDQFVRLQIAGDLLPDAPTDPFEKLAGLGFLGLGAEYYRDGGCGPKADADELDDRVDTLTRGFLGLTVACARCHDHKFDPIPTRDYYSLAGIYVGTKLTNTPVVPPAEVKAYDEAQAKVKQQEELVNGLLGRVARSAVVEAVPLTGKYLLAARAVKKGRKKVDEVVKADGLHRYFLDRWVKFLDPSNFSKAPPPFKELFSLSADAPEAEVHQAAAVAQAALQKVEIPTVMASADKKGGGSKTKSNDPLVKAMFQDQTAPFLVLAADAEKLFLTDNDRTQLVSLRTELDQRKASSPKPPLQAHVLSGNGSGMSVLVRGNPATKGEDAPKGFLRVLSSTTAKSGKDFNRLDLAKAIASRDNPLTARVMVNRVWAWHFGRGLVNTPSNFGSLGDRPSHPELLDHLTVGFVANGWSLKWLHRQIMTSEAYQLSSEPNLLNDKVDAANVYLWRGSRKRLDVEVWRDSLLMVSGKLDPTAGGPTFNLKDPSSRRRTVYAKVSRHELDSLLRLFDFPDANVTADKRTTTTVPQQQLFALNSEFMLNQARAFAARAEKSGGNDVERIVAAYKLAFQREPAPGEVELGEQFLKLPARADDKITRWQQYAQAILASNEFLYVD